jgi:putative peptidoglycan lipid II flippase
MTVKRQMFRSSVVVGVFSFLGSLTGILVETSIAAHLGLSKNSDTFYAAFTIPYIMTNLLRVTGQFSLVPFFSSLETRHSDGELWGGFSYATNFVFLGLAGISALGALASPLLIRGIAPGFTPRETALAIQLSRWLFLILAPAGIAEVIRSLLFSQRRFVVAASGNFLRNVTVIAFVVFDFRRHGFYSIVLGYLAGHVVQLLIFAAHLLTTFPVRYSLTLEGSGEAFRNLRGAGTVQMTTALGRQGLVVVERMIASFLPPGTLTALGYGVKIISTLSDLLAGSVGTASLPTLSRAFARQEREEVRRGLRHAIEITLLLISPAVVFCLILSPNIIRLIFERGNFTLDATVLMGQILFYYSLCLPFLAGLRILNFYLFARNEVTAFLHLAMAQVGLNLVLDLLYVVIFRWTTAGIPLALLTSLMVPCAMAYARNLGSVRESLDSSLAGYALKVLAASALATLPVWALRVGLAAPKTGVGNFIFLCEACGSGVAAFFAALLVLRVVKISQIGSLLKQAES